jgi:nitroimidazol reductase NimA-like FMN-containing flavoprotein (pyridoxamine 5'-phosphate oxidase superfamily)
MAHPAPSARAQVRRAPNRADYSPATLHAILDEGIVAHVGFTADGFPAVVPTGYARDGEHLLLHGSTASRLMRVAATQPVCVTVTLLDGLVLARSAFNHSMNYRSAVVYGQGRVLEGDEKRAAMRTFMEKLLPGRWDAARPPDAKEMLGTMVVALPLSEASCKVRAGPPLDEERDMEFACWAGVVPLRTVPDPPVQDPKQAPMPVPAEVASWRPGRRQGHIPSVG